MTKFHSPRSHPTKSELRTAALTRRDALTPAERAAAAEAVAVRGLPIAPAGGRVVAGYSPIRGELDPFPLMRALQAQGARLALPAIVGRDQPLVFRDWSFGRPLVPGRFGILEPAPDMPAVEPDIVLVPMAAFDRAGHRVGYGAGFYDRTLGRSAAGRPVTVGLAFATQEVDRVGALPHDVGLDYIATERETIALRSVAG
ncbi:MAG: 5-formyltetrahydrofolate cyclo-ligase [Xanthobacteraceae bacterium]|nr:5-formyltetrahydrofolate cyclo-ligase [Xanthobacteraceae bacterium]